MSSNIKSMNNEFLLGCERYVVLENKNASLISEAPALGNWECSNASLTSEAVVFSAVTANLTELLKGYEERFNLKEWESRISLFEEYENSDKVVSLSILPTNSQIPQILYAKKTRETSNINDRLEENFFSKCAASLLDEKQMIDLKVEEKLIDSVETGEKMIAQVKKENPKAYNAGKLIMKLMMGKITQEQYDEQTKPFLAPVETVPEPVVHEESIADLNLDRPYTPIHERLIQPAGSIKILSGFLKPSPKFNLDPTEYRIVGVQNPKKTVVKTSEEIDELRLNVHESLSSSVKNILKQFVNDYHSQEIALVGIDLQNRGLVQLNFSK